MKPFAVLIFEINRYKSETVVEFKVGPIVKTSEKPNKGFATIWLHSTTEEKWKTSIPIDREKSCVKLCRPLAWNEAEMLMQGLKRSFDQLGIEHYDLTDSDD